MFEEILEEKCKVNEMVKGFLASFKFNKDVDVTVPILFSSGKGTKKSHPFDTEIPDGILMASQQCEKLFFIMNHNFLPLDYAPAQVRRMHHPAHKL